MKISYQEYKIYSYKGTPQVYFDYIYRHVSHVVTYVFLLVGFTPMMLSVTSIILAMLAGVVLGSGYAILGMSLFMLSYLFDFCDGNAARVFIKTSGLTEVQKRKGNLVETLNTNISLVSMYGGLGMYLVLLTGNVFFLLFSFVVCGFKLSSRYLIRAGYDSFKDVLSSKKPGSEMMKSYNSSAITRIKFFLTKCVFSANFYYIVYFLAFLTPFAPYIFVVYASVDGLMSVLRGIHVFTRKYNL